MQTLQELIHQRRQRDTISMFTLDIKKDKDGRPWILEVGEPGCGTDDDTNEKVLGMLNSTTINPKQAPVVLVDSHWQDRYFQEGNVVVIPDKKELITLLQNPIKHDSKSVNFENYLAIIIDRHPSLRRIPTQEKTFHINDDFFTPFGEEKYVSSQCLTTQYAPKTIFFGQGRPHEILEEFEHQDVVIKSNLGYASIGVRFINQFTVQKLKSALSNFSIEDRIEEWPCLTDQERVEETRKYFPNIMQPRITDFPIHSQTTNNYHISIDRVAAMITSKAGKINVHYLGGVHRFDKQPYGSQPRPICIQANTAFTEEFTDNQHQNMESFVQQAMQTMYHNALAITPNLYKTGKTDIVDEQQIELEQYFTQ